VIAALLLAQAAAPPEAVELVVTARRQRCGVALKGAALSDGALDRLAADWRDGRPVRVGAPAGAPTRCLAKLMFRLQDRGVTQAEFVSTGLAVTPPPSPAPSTAATPR
jgi:hypothetical protein